MYADEHFTFSCNEMQVEGNKFRGRVKREQPRFYFSWYPGVDPARYE